MIAVSGESLLYSTDAESIRLHDYDNVAWTDIMLGEEVITSPSLNTLGMYLFGSRTAEGASRLGCWLGGDPLWATDLPGTMMTNVATDYANSMYLATYDPTAPGSLVNGISCLLADRTAAWFYPTGNIFVTQVSLASEGLLTCVGRDSAAGEFVLIGIRGG